MQHYGGSKLGIRALVALYTTLGYRAVKIFVSIVSLIYAVTTRKKILPKLKRYYNLVGLKPTLYTYIRHIYAFSLTIFDRTLSDVDGFLENTHRTQINKENLYTIGQQGGFVFISHFGNNMQGFKIFDTFDITINLVVDERAPESLTQAVKESKNNPRLRTINLADGIGAMLEIGAAIKRKEAVIMAVDRVDDIKNSLEIDFLGERALFNTMPFKIAKKLNAPFVALNVIREGDQRLIIDISAIVQTQRKSDLETLIRTYSSSLQRCVKKYPLQWFNFYDFWDHSQSR